MLTVAYCRVSTTEQAEEGFSIDGQTERLRAYAELHDLGDVTVVSDPGASGKDTKRPGLQQVLSMVEAGHVAHVLIWRLDRLSRNLGDLIELADYLGEHDVSLHSFTEKIDLSSATGRMFYNVLGSFAQFYREQLAENVTMGLHQAIRQGRWVNRPPTGYDLDHGVLIPNGQADTIRRIYKLRAAGDSYPTIAERTGITQSTVGRILDNRVYLGLVPLDGEWLPGLHEALVTEAEFAAAHRGHTTGIRRGKDLMSGRVTCGLCGRRMSVEQNGKGQRHYRCRHRGQGCQIPSRSNQGLLRAARLGIDLLFDQRIREMVRSELEVRARSGRQAARTRAPAAAARLTELRSQRTKLLNLHYQDQITADQFGEEQARLSIEIQNLEAITNDDHATQHQADDLAHRFDQLIDILDRIDLDTIWTAANDTERRAILDELIAAVTVHPNHLTVELHGSLPLNVRYSEVGLKDSENTQVSGPT